MKEYEEVRDQLLNMLEELDDRLGKITNDVRHVDNPLSKDFSEQATEAENDEVIDAIGNATRAEVEKIKQAIVRIDAGTYGICQGCGEPIKPERLAVMPYATLCIRCAETSQRR